MQSVQPRKVVDVNRGMFLVRYVSAEDPIQPPTVRITPETNFVDDIRFVLHPDEDDVVLRHPGASLVMLADTQGRLAIDIAPARRQGSVAAKVTIEALNQDIPMAVPQTARKAVAALAIDDFEIVGHVSGRGDVAVRANDWLAGPTAPSRIEGLRLTWPSRPDGLTLRYAVTTSRPHAASRQPVDLGGFAGTRGKAMPLVGLALDISGPGAVGRRLSAEMIFLGAPILRLSGPRISGSGTTGREPLVGLRLTVEEDAPQQRRHPPEAPQRAPKPVRIYRIEDQKARGKV